MTEDADVNTTQSDWPSTTSDDNFDDTEQLGQDLVDKRAADTERKSTFDDAKAIVDNFAASTESAAWATLDRATVAQRLSELVTLTDDQQYASPSSGPRSLKQGGMNLCGPAAFFQSALGRDPVAVMQFATDLFNVGSASIGALTISPGRDLLDADFTAMSAKGNTSSQAEWMLLGALRNSTDVFWQGSWEGDPDQRLAAMTRPEELADWMKRSEIWSSVEDHGKWATNPGIPNALNLTLAPGTDIAWLINTNLIAKSKLVDSKASTAVKPDDSFLLSSFPDHWVVLLNEPLLNAVDNNVMYSIWSWGQRYWLSAPQPDFVDNYYGAVIAKL
ncbi:MAG: hypothetical protein ABI612_03895 [Betaproteobacteria bacterium]